MFKRHNNAQTTTEDILPHEENKLSIIQENPKIFLIDFDSKVEIALKEKGFNASLGTSGNRIEVPNTYLEKSHKCILNCDIPLNFHEFEIVLIDLKTNNIVPYKEDEHIDRYVQGSKNTVFLSVFPETIFNPQPICAASIQSELNEIVNRGGIIVVFASALNSIEYTRMTIEAHDQNISHYTYTNYSFSQQIPIKGTKFGKEIFVEDQTGIFNEILTKYLKEMSYEIIFYPPREIDAAGNYVPDKNFLPLMRNKDGEIVSFYKPSNNGSIFIFPQMENKENFVTELMDRIFPSLFPALFPYHTQFLWLKDYQLPHEAEIQQKKENLIEEFNKKINQINKENLHNEEKYKCLHNLITENSDKLVKSVENYFNWLGFKNVRNMDEIKPDQKEEDLQIDLDNGLLVIEIKGLGGTSTDSECAQINKIKYRRCEERGKFDVYALYLVNHQRFLPPLKRNNPPFKDSQIRDATNEKRGLLTTWQMFKLYNMIKINIISREEARQTLLNVGLIEFHPSNCISFGQPEHIYQNGIIIIVTTKTSVKTNDKLIIKRKDDYFLATILELKVDDLIKEMVDKDITVGIKTDIFIKKTDEILYKIINQN